MIRALCSVMVIAAVMVAVLGTSARAQQVADPPNQPDRIRGLIEEVDDGAIVLETRDGATVQLAVAENLSVFKLAEASFTDVEFGTYVGSASRRLDAFSPFVRDSLSWLHEGYELRIIDDELRGIAVGHTSWDLTPESVMSHGWVDDLEVRVISIKYGPTEEEETDVDIPRDAPVLRMSLGDKSLIQPGAHVLAGAQKDGDGNYAALFLMVGENGIVPPL